MRRQTLVALAVAVVLGLVAVFLANTFLSSSAARNKAEALTPIAVAAVPLDYGTAVTRDKVRFANYPASSVPPGAFTDPNLLFGPGKQRVALMSMGMNEPILATKVTGEGQNASIAALLPEGMRAASVRINDVSGVAGFVQPNDSVDVLITRTIPDGNRQITDMLLQDIRVIAIGQDSKAAGEPKLAKTATLEVDPLSAQKLALAQEVGSLSLVLRKPGEDGSSPYVETVSINDLRYNRFGPGYRAAPAQGTAPKAAPKPVARRTAPRPVAKAAPKPAPNNVEIVRGTEGSKYDVGGYDS